MPLLLRRSAPSPTVDELAFACPSAPMTSRAVSIRGSMLQTQFDQQSLQRCSTHSNLTASRRRRSTAGTDGDFFVLPGKEPHEISRVSTQEDFDDMRSSKRSNLDEDVVTTEWETESDPERSSSAQSCECSCRGSESCVSSVRIQDKQLAVVDMEIRDLRKTFAKQIYRRISMSFSRKKQAKQLTM